MPTATSRGCACDNFAMRSSRSLFLVAVLTACGAHHDLATPDASAPDAPSGDPCTGDVTRCSAGDWQKCVGGVFQTSDTCSATCSANLGCVACDPTVGAATCAGSDVVACNADGSFGAMMQACGAGTTCSAGACTNVCTADGVDLVYVVDEQNDFLSFDPRKLPGDPFVKIGTLACPTTQPSIQSGNAMVMPFSMGVDRDGKAWVEYTSGEVFNVSLTDASCTASGYVARAGGMDLFGMGFVTDSATATTEKLFTAGGGDSAGPMGKLAVVDTHAGMYTPTQVGTLTAASDFSPELTGTNEAKLYGFFPVITSGPAYVQEIDRTSGAPVGSTYPLGTTGLGNQIRDWAFAQWGGVFYIFVTTTDANGVTDSTVRAIDKATGAYAIVIDNLAFNIDGAGVSTCAPSVVQ